ncbi:DUF6712 family protein [uncultured Sunxiuqinia sp.]|uniref:DUF6712 family protein n=1 Tax=uncultured Sunxiuqinia sp. TaxID=1573825 RepID=UPI00262D4A25|nr:DUF6712 family protein [uncultured Sunxiuqinia sp.]
MIVKTIDQFQKAVPTTVSIENFSDVEPYIASAELWTRSQVLGNDLYAYVDALVDPAGDDLTLQKLCINIISNHAYWDAIPFLDLVHTESGFAVISANNKVPASKERVERLREQCLIRRDNETELLITFLEGRIIYHDDWKGSPAYSVMTDCLIRTATELQQYGSWEGSRRDFLKLRPKLIQETMMRLEPVFSKDYIEELIEKQRDNEIVGDDVKVIELLKYAIGSLVNGNPEAAEKIAADALRYMDSHLISFPTYTASSEYLARTMANYENDADSPIFSSLH